MYRRKVVIGTRGSQLALWQTNWVKHKLEQAHPGLTVEIKIIKTRGDASSNLPKLGQQGKGIFTKELEDEMLTGLIDLAVHSLKDLPTELPAGLHIGAMSEREDVRDALVARAQINSFGELPRGARIGTSSPRRQAQIWAIRPDLVLEPIRGNVDTRLAKLDRGDYDAVILAAAGLHRLGLADRITQYLSEDIILPAVGQGALAIESRINDEATDELISIIDHKPTRLACQAERAFLKALGGGCMIPIAAHAKIEAGRLVLAGLVASPDGSQLVRDVASAPIEEAESIGQRLAEALLNKGARQILAAAARLKN
jgi:hydroxymethylbilane synthase